MHELATALCISVWTRNARLVNSLNLMRTASCIKFPGLNNKVLDSNRRTKQRNKSPAGESTTTGSPRRRIGGHHDEEWLMCL